jgi:hypothetical protein
MVFAILTSQRPKASGGKLLQDRVDVAGQGSDLAGDVMTTGVQRLFVVEVVKRVAGFRAKPEIESIRI